MPAPPRHFLLVAFYAITWHAISTGNGTFQPQITSCFTFLQGLVLVCATPTAFQLLHLKTSRTACYDILGSLKYFSRCKKPYKIGVLLTLKFLELVQLGRMDLNSNLHLDIIEWLYEAVAHVLLVFKFLVPWVFVPMINRPWATELERQSHKVSPLMSKVYQEVWQWRVIVRIVSLLILAHSAVSLRTPPSSMTPAWTSFDASTTRIIETGPYFVAHVNATFQEAAGIMSRHWANLHWFEDDDASLCADLMVVVSCVGAISRELLAIFLRLVVEPVLVAFCAVVLAASGGRFSPVFASTLFAEEQIVHHRYFLRTLLAAFAELMCTQGSLVQHFVNPLWPRLSSKGVTFGCLMMLYSGMKLYDR